MPDALSLQPEPHGRGVIVRLIGELDASTGPLFPAQLERLLSGRIERLVLDLSQARVRDTQGVCGLLRAHQRWELSGCQLILCDVPPVAQGMLSLLGVAAHLRIVDAPTAQALLETSRTGPSGWNRDARPETADDDWSGSSGE